MADSETDLEQFLIQRECEALSIDYARHLDFKNYDAFIDLFTDDLHLDAGGPIDGKEHLRRAMARRPDSLRSSHVLTNIHVDVLDSVSATGIAYLSLYRHIGAESELPEPVEFSAPAAVGHYTDKFVRTSEGFRIASRVLSFAFRNSAKF